MAPPDTEEEKESNSVACVLLVSLVSGASLTLVGAWGARSDALLTCDRLMVFDAAWRDGWEEEVPVLTMTRTFRVLTYVGLCIVLAAGIGIVGAKFRRRCLVCIYLVLAAALACLMVMGGIEAIERKGFVEPLLGRQVAALCNSTTYVRLAAHIPCPWAAAYDPLEIGECNAVCQWHVGLLRQLDGCSVMPKLCQEFFYEELGDADCRAALAENPEVMFGTSTDAETCRELCDRDIKCELYAFSAASAAKPDRCVLGSGIASQHRLPEWAALRPAEAADYLAPGGPKCHRRTAPRVLDSVRVHGTWLAASTLLLAAVLSLSTLATCCLMYNVTVRRQGKPDANDLGMMMCCPCCSDHLHDKYNQPILPSDEEAGAE